MTPTAGGALGVGEVGREAPFSAFRCSRAAIRSFKFVTGIGGRVVVLFVPDR